MNMYDIIERKKRGQSLTKEQINFFINGTVSGDIPDYQLSALLMAITLKGMSQEETFYLTDAMANSGEVESRGSLSGIVCDKHSTGGVSDSTTLIVTPILAALNLKVAKLSGRGLGFTGGTLDKLESFKGFNVNLTRQEFFLAVKNVGAAVAGQTLQTAPADKKLYALRDVTATIDSIPLICASVMSKKLASFADIIMLDVKFGSGAFIKSANKALELAKLMVGIGNAAGRKTCAVVSNMNQPLGNFIGCKAEVLECIDILRGNSLQSSLRTLAIELAARIYMQSTACTYKQATQKCQEVLQNGVALKKFKQIIKNQGGEFEIEKNSNIKTQIMLAKSSGIFYWKNAQNLGKAALYLGGGRTKVDDVIDKSVGVEILIRSNQAVKKGQPIAKIMHSGAGLDKAQEAINSAYTITSKIHAQEPLVYAYLDSANVEFF